MPRALLDVFTLLNRYDRVVECSIRLFSSAPNLTRRIYYLGFAAIAISHAIEQGPPSLAELRQRSVLINLQQRLNSFCYERDLPFTADLDFITDPNSAGRAAAFFLVHDDDRSCAEVARFAMLSNDRVLDSSIQLFDRLEEDRVAAFILGYVRAQRAAVRDRIACRLIAGLVSSKKWHLTVFVILQLEVDARRQCMLLWESDWLGEALNVALLAKIIDVIPMIGYRASLLGMDSVLNECERMLAAQKETKSATSATAGRAGKG
jgi:hypothetical protein